MLSRSRRVPKSLFPLILKRARVGHSQFLSLRVWRDGQADFPAKFSVIAGGKISNRANERNLWKRRARAVLVKIHKQIKNNHYCLLYLKPEVKNLNYQQLTKEIVTLFTKTNLFSTKP